MSAYLADEIPKRPVGLSISVGREGDTKDDEEDVSDGEADDEQVGGTSHHPIEEDDEDDEQVPHQAQDDDAAEQSRHEYRQKRLELRRFDVIIERILLSRPAGVPPILQRRLMCGGRHKARLVWRDGNRSSRSPRKPDRRRWHLRSIRRFNKIR